MYIVYVARRAGRRLLPVRDCFAKKIISALLVIACLFMASDLKAQKVTLNLQGVPLQQVLQEIKQQTGYLFLYDEEKVSKAGKVSIKATQEELQAVLTRLLSSANFTFSIIDKTIVLKQKTATPGTDPGKKTAADLLTITGNVKDGAGKPLHNVSVTVKGINSRGTISNEAGEFSLSGLRKGMVIVVSSIGYVTVERRVIEQLVLTVVLTEDAARLSDVVVTALGISKGKRTLTSSVANVDGASLVKARESNMAYAFAGKMAGVSVGNVSGGPGSSSNIIIRGVNSLKGSPPLYVIDGVPIDNTFRGGAGKEGGADLGDGIGNINPDDIEVVTVLKGASAAALYGSRASGGVIVIKTKSGKGQKGLGVELNSNFLTEKAVDLTDFQYEYGHGTNGQKPTTQAQAQGTIFSWGAKLDGSDVVQFDGVARPYVARKDNFRNFYRTGTTFTNTVSVSNSSEKANVRFSASALRNKGIIPNTGLRRNTLNLNTQIRIIPKLTLNILANYVTEEADRNGASLNASALNANFSMLFLPTSYDVRDLKPGYNPSNGAETLPWTGNPFYNNPWFVANRMGLGTRRGRVIGIAGLNYEIADWLSAQVRLGYDRSDDRATQIEPTGMGFKPGGYIFDAFMRYREINSDFLVTATKEVSPSISLTGIVGGNIRRNEYERLASEGSNFSIPFLYTLANTTTGKNSYYNLRKTEVQSLYFNGEASYKNLLFINVTGRQDWFSALDGRSIFYPSAGAAFVFSDLLKWSPLSYGKLRTSWARTTSDPTSLAYQTSLYYNFSGTANSIPLGQIINDAIPDLKLKPNKITEVEAGLELKFFGNRLSMDVAFYNRQIKDEPINITTSVTSGYKAATLNAGTLENKGIELLVSGTPIKTSRFTWTVSVNYTKNNNKVKSLAGNAKEITVAQSGPGQSFISHVVGHAAAQVMAFDYKRDDKGNILFDAGGLPVQGMLTPMGTGIHPVFGGVNNEFKYRNISFSFLVDFKSGAKVYSGTDYYALRYGLDKRSLVGRETGVVGEGVTNGTNNPNTVSVFPATYYDQLAKRISSTLVYDASFAKLRQIIIGYDLPQAVLKRTPFKAANLSLVARNVAILKKYTDNIDPEGSYSPTLAGQGLVQAALPFTRSYGVNLNIKL